MRQVPSTRSWRPKCRSCHTSSTFQIYGKGVAHLWKNQGVPPLRELPYSMWYSLIIGGLSGHFDSLKIMDDDETHPWGTWVTLSASILVISVSNTSSITISITTATFTITCYITATCYITIIISSTSSDPFRLLNNLSVDFLCHLVGHHVGLTVDFLVHHQEILRKNRIHMPKTMMTIMMMIMTDPFTTNLVVKGPVVKGSVVKGATSGPTL